MIIAYGDAATKCKAVEKGAEALLSKPIRGLSSLRSASGGHPTAPAVNVPTEQASR
jgi:hypothetical protein